MTLRELAGKAVAAMFVGAVLVSGCAQMERDWQAHQAAQAEAQRRAQPANKETLCKAVSDGHCNRCFPPGTSCSDTYLACLGGAPPGQSTGLDVGQVEMCSIDLKDADCNVLAAHSFPASCTPKEQPVAATPDAGASPAPSASSPPAPAPSTEPPATLTVAEACDGLVQDNCNRCRPREMKKCFAQSRNRCYAGRDGTAMTALTRDQQRRCASAYRKLKCQAVATGFNPVECQGLR